MALAQKGLMAHDSQVLVITVALSEVVDVQLLRKSTLYLQTHSWLTRLLIYKDY